MMRAPKCRHRVGRVLPHVVVEGKPAVGGERQHGEGGELLGERCGMEHRGRRDRHTMLEIRQTVSAGVDDVSVLHHGDRAAG